MKCYDRGVTATTIAQRDLRNRSGDILRRARAGETFVVTTRGEPMAILCPPATPARPASRVASRPARRSGGWAALPLAVREGSSQEILDELRAERW